MSYQDKTARARAMIAEHNQASLAIDPNIKPVDPTAVFGRLVALGGSTEEALTNLTWEDLEGCGVPRILARRIANEVFRQQVTLPEHARGQSYVTERGAARLTIPQLLEVYDPTGTSNVAVTHRLRELIGKAPCLAFGPDGKLDIQVSVNLIEDMRMGIDPPANVKLTGGEYVKPLQVGQPPTKVRHQNPLYPNLPLRDGLVCSQTETRWEDTPQGLETRQLVYLAMKTGELRVTKLADAHDFVDLHNRVGHTGLRSRWPQAAGQFDELKRAGGLPPLTMTIGAADLTASRLNDPFGGHRRT